MIKKMNVITRLLIIPAIIVLMGLILAVPVSAQLQLPHAFYGNVTINGEPAPIGTVVEARCEGAKVPAPGNPIMTSEVGKYGSESETGVKLIVQGEGIEGNSVISFYINGHLADQTAKWQTGEITSLDLAVTITTTPTTPENGGGTSSAETSTLQCSLFGEERNISISNTGEILGSIEISSTLPSGKVTVSINAGTKALDKDGNPLTSLTSDANPTPPPAPEGYTIYIACNFGPDGATFDPPIVLTFEYSPGDIPENTDEEDLVIAFYDNSIREWVTLATEVDTVNHTVTASVSHFTSFAVVFPQVEQAPQETPSSISPTPSPKETPSSILPTPSPEENPTPPSQEPELTEPTPTPGPAPEEEPSVPQTTPASEQTESNTNWYLFIIIAAVIIGGIVVGLLIRRIQLRNN